VSQPFGNQPTTPLGGGPPTVGGPATPGAFGQPPAAPPPRKSNWVVWLLGGCGCSVVLLAICCGTLGYIGATKGPQMLGKLLEGPLREEVADNDDVKEHLGEIESLTANFMASAQEQKERGGGNWLVMDAKGSKGKGTFIVETVPGAQGSDAFKHIELRTEEGKTFEIK